ncbi:MAG: ECF transporter S component [Peptostreptococcus porci]|nr:ECF transporter S component [Peptostreptococcus porci]
MNAKSISLTGLFIAIGVILPLLCHAVGLGSTILPMHFAPLLCGIFAGPKEGLICGIITPIVSSILIAMPPLYPVAISMSVELAVYGFIIGVSLRYFLLRQGIYLSSMISLILAMVSGRICAGFFYVIFFHIHNEVYTWSIFLATMFLKALPGILLQIIIIPLFVTLLVKQNPRTIS